jgi:hypothetical protein
MIDGMQCNGLSQSYIDRIDSLFAKHVPTKQKNTLLHKLSAAAIANVLAKSGAPAGNVRILRSFVGQIFVRASLFDGRLLQFPRQMSEQFLPKWQRHHDVRYPELNRLDDENFERIFRYLENETNYWQQSHAIRLFFEFHAPLTRILSGEWRQIVDKHWYPYYPGQKRYWIESGEQISESIQTILDRVAILSKKDFGASQYWFPSKFGRSFEYVRSVDTVWRDALSFCSLPYYPIREFARSYRNPNTPSYFVNFLRRYGLEFADPQNVAKLSKTLIDRQKLPINSDNYIPAR